MFMLPEGTMISAFIGGAISKVINDGVDYTKPTIRNVLNDKNNRNYSTKIYRIIEKSLNIVTNNTYIDSDILYDAIEKIFIEFKNHGDTLESVKCGLDVLGTDVSDQRCENFLEKFYERIRSDDDLYKASMMDLEQMGIKISQEEFQRLNEKVDNLTEIVSRENDNKIDLPKREPVKSRTQEYADKWNQNMFLNNFDKRDENAGVNVKLREVYLDKHLPHYIWANNQNTSNDLKDLLEEYIYPHNENKMLLILGQPGIGKSTLITWLLTNFKRVLERTLVYQFATDLKNMDVCDLDKDKKILTLGELEISFNDLEGKILILDGFDEINLRKDRAEILNFLYRYLIWENLIKDFSLIVTCRENYIQTIYRINCDNITLQPWEIDQIQSFCKIYSKKTKSSISVDTMNNIIKNKDVLGIPLILYMVLALDISVEKEGSIVDVYDQIFSLKEGGIYERCFVNIKVNKMEKYDDPHWVYVLKEQIHQISRDISTWMFENNPDVASITRDQYMRICTNITEKSNQNVESIKQDVLIGSYFKLVRHTEGIGTEELSFVHRSIYEYFYVEYLCVSMCKAISESKEQLAGLFGNFLKAGKLSETMCEFLKHKVRICELRDKFDFVKDAFELMLRNGMIYYTGINYRNAGKLEGLIFANMLEVLHSWEQDFFYFNSEIVWYLIHNEYESLNLNKLDLHNKNIKGAYLERAHLREVDLRGINLERVDLRGADLRGAILDENQVKHLNGICDLNETKVYFKDTNELVNFEKCRRAF